MRPARLIARLFPAFMLVTLLALGAALLYAEHAVRVFHENQTALELETELQLLREVIPARLGDAAALQKFLGETGRRADTRYTLIAPDGRVLADSQEEPARMENHATRPEVQQARAGQTPARATRFSVTRLETLLYTAILIGAEGNARPVLRAARPVKGLNASLRSLEWHMFGVAVLIFALAALASYWLARRAVRRRPSRAAPAAVRHRGSRRARRSHEDHGPAAG